MQRTIQEDLLKKCAKDIKSENNNCEDDNEK